MDPTLIITGVSSVISLISTVLPLIPGVGGSSQISSIVKTIGDILPMAANQIGATYTGLKNIIAAVGSHPATTAEQKASLAAFDKQVDDAWNAVEGDFDPDAPGAA